MDLAELVRDRSGCLLGEGRPGPASHAPLLGVHDGECIDDPLYDGYACCPLGEDLT